MRRVHNNFLFEHLQDHKLRLENWDMVFTRMMTRTVTIVWGLEDKIDWDLSKDWFVE